MRWTILLFMLVACSSSGITQEPVADASRVEFRYIGNKSLEQLSAGAVGQGFLLYYFPQRGLAHPSLVVRLSKQSDTDVAMAQVFDTPPDTNYVPIRIGNDTVTLIQTYSPTIVIQAIGGWWTRDGLVNYNLDIQVNGPVYAMWGGGYDSKSGPFGWTARIKPGEPTASIHVRDPNQEGIPKWDWRSLLPSFLRQEYIRTNYAERKCKTPLKTDLGVSPLWPFVGWSGGYEQANGVLYPPIVMDWQKGKITHFSELVTVRHQNCSYALYSVTRLEPGEINQPDFEAPFAFYDLSGEGKSHPNLILRTERFPAGDPASIGLDVNVLGGQPITQDFETVRYSWRDAVGDGFWDYKIEVLGSHPYNFSNPIAGQVISTDAPPYEQFPQWVVERDWPITTFIDTEGNSYQSDEGIYDWSPRDVGIRYVLGWDEGSDPQAFSEIRAGFRGEFRLQNNLPPKLYSSPIDNQLHLLNADGGQWNLGNGRVLAEHNLGESRYINGWTRERGSEMEEAFYALNGYLIYSGSNSVVLRQAAYQPSNFEILPPADNTSWQLFRNQLAPYANQKRDPDDLHSWLSHFSGKSVNLIGAQISDVRAVANGFRFVLDLQPGFRLLENDLLDVGALAPGRYVLTYDGRLAIEPLTPPALSVSLTDATLTQLEPSAIQLALRNDGRQDVSSATLELWAAHEHEPASLVVTQTITLLAQLTITPTLEWSPPFAGPWTLASKIRQADGNESAFDLGEINVQAAKTADSATMIAISTYPETIFAVIGGLLAFATIAALVFGSQWKRI